MNNDPEAPMDQPSQPSNTTPPQNSGTTPETWSALTLWCRHAAGESLSQVEARELQTQWQTNPDLRQKIADERWIDQLLRLQVEPSEKTDEFVAQVMKKCAISTTPATPVEPMPGPQRIGPSGHHHRPQRMSEFDSLLSTPLPSGSEQIAAPIIATTPLDRATKSPTPKGRWAWAAAAALLVGLSAVGISYPWYSTDRANQTGASRIPPANPEQEQPSVGHPAPQLNLPTDGGLPSIDPNIQVHLNPPQTPANSNDPVAEGPTDPSHTDPSSPPAIADVDPSLPAPDTRSQAIAQGSSDPNPVTESPTDSSPILATISRVDRPNDDPQVAADTAWQLGQRLGANEVVQIASGELQLTLASGVMIDVFAPSRLEIVSNNAIRLWQGEIAAQVPPPAVGFQILTPAATVTDLGTTFDVLVDPLGTTEIEVRSGQVSVATVDQNTQLQWLLTDDDAYNLTLFSPSQPRGPNNKLLENDSLPNPTAWASRLRRVSGRITGVVALDGRSLQFDDETVFATVKDRLFRGVASSEASLSDTWSQFVEASTAGPQPQGQLRLNDQEFNFGNFNEAVKAQNEVFAQFAPERMGARDPNRPAQNPVADPPPRLGPLPGLENFRGSLMLHGQRRDFNSWEEYRAALKELMGPLAEFGGFNFLP